MKNSMKLAFCLLASILFIGIGAFAQNTKVNYKYKYNTIPVEQPVPSKSMLPAIDKYKAGNYVGAMVDLKEIVEKEPNNMYAKYYLALCYTQLGYQTEATESYSQVAEEGDNFSLRYRANIALSCLEDPNNDICKPPKKVTAPPPAAQTEAKVRPAEEVDDITKFIQSGKKIHPSAMDKITRERMERKIQADEYSRKQAEEEAKKAPKPADNDTTKKSDASTPTNEEIVAALDTLAKIGINPLNQFSAFNLLNIPYNALSDYGMDNQYNPMYNLMLSNGSMDVAKIMMYNKMAQQNNILNYGI